MKKEKPKQKVVCSGCPVKFECLEEAMKFPNLLGFGEALMEGKEKEKQSTPNLFALKPPESIFCVTNSLSKNSKYGMAYF